MTAADRPTVPHPDLDTLADLDAGVLDPAAAEDVAAHVGGCARCTAAMTAFDAVRADLLDLPPPAMPESVAARLDATLADLRRGGTGAAAGSGPAGGALVSAPVTRSPAQPLGLPPQSPPPPHLPQAGGPPRPPEPPRPVADMAAARQARERRRRSIKLSTVAAAAAFVLVAAGASVAALVDSANEKGTVAGAPTNADNLPPGDPAPGTGAAAPTESNRIPAYTKASLPGALESISSTSAVEVIEQLGETGPGGQMANRTRRQACIASIPTPAGAVTAFRRIDFEGQPAYVFVFTNLATGDRTAKVVTMDCGMTGALPATVLDEVR